MMASLRYLFSFLALALATACSPGSSDTDGGGDGGDGGDVCQSAGLHDSDGDGIADGDEGDDSVDTDGDGTPDFLDDDSDGDGWPDQLEAGTDDCGAPRDADGDEIPDFQDLDSDGNGLPDREENDNDLDDDGVPNWADTDDDGDEIDDVTEMGPDPADPVDADGDGVPDYHDQDSDGDTIPDLYEGMSDEDDDGRPNFRDEDSDGDGWLDIDEYGAEQAGDEPVDTDDDGTPDFRDIDSDGDRLDDAMERELGTSRVYADSDGDEFTDYQEVQAGTDPIDSTSYPMPDPCNPSECLPVEVCGEGSGDGIDNNCNGEVDEICPCSTGETRPCFPGTPAQRGLGICTDGLLSCDEFGQWSDCLGGVYPEVEVCDGADNDCDGLFDEDLEGCESPVQCPGTRSESPLSTIELNGSDIYDGEYDSWTWDVFCPPTVDTCPTPDDPTAQDTTIYVISSGAYRVRATIVNGEDTYTCQFTIEVQGDGLRVELNWDTQGSANGNTDVDLHLHRPETTTDWFTADDCYFSNCKASAWSGGTGGLDWGYEHTYDLSACDEAPHGYGDDWEEIGFCANPRLDVDIISCDSSVTDATSRSFCSPENINVDNPALGETFRIMVNYYSGDYSVDVTHPTVNIYCGGGLRATFGEGDVELIDSGASMGDNWLVADVTFMIDECGGIDCRVNPILNDEEGPWIQTGSTDFGPPW